MILKTTHTVDNASRTKSVRPSTAFRKIRF
jgi:hypothetical protein